MFHHLKTTVKVVVKNGALVATLAGLVFVGSLPAIGANHSSDLKPDEALQRLKEGNDRFSAGHNDHPHITLERRQETAKNGQHPFASVVSCSDSRVPLEVLFDRGIGDIFAIRVAGNVCNGDEIGSVEYGIEHLGTPVLVVLGHTRCGAVTAVVQGADLHGNIRALVQNIFAAVDTAKKTHPEAEGDALLTASIEANVWQSIDDLLKNSPVTRERVHAGKLKVVGAVYDIEEGYVKWLGEYPAQEQVLKDAGSGVKYTEAK